MTDTAKKWTLADGIAECKRELAIRKNVYPTFIARGRHTQEEADGYVARLEGTLRFLEFCANNEATLRSLLERASGAEKAGS
jgi:hypothetical protein